jgi:hypothetical protein
VGQYALTITPATADGNALATLNVVLKITASCEGDYIAITPPTFADNIEYTLSFADKIIPTAWTIVPSSCRVTYAASIPAVIQTPVTFDAVTLTVSITTQPIADTYVGIHEIEVTPSTPGGVAVTASKATFNLDIAKPCEPPALEVTMESVADVLYILNASSFTIGTSWTSNMASCTPSFAVEY